MEGKREIQFLKEAVRLSREKMLAGLGGPFGAVVVKEGEIIARGYNCVTSLNDPTAHAEIVAIRNACAKLESFQLTGCDLYTSCEPCPMCLGAIYWARPRRVIYANTKEDVQAIGFDDLFIYEEIAKPPKERSIPMIHIPLEEAKEVFQLWVEKPDKILY